MTRHPCRCAGEGDVAGTALSLARRARIAILVSGNGSNLQAILDACASGNIDGDVVCVVSDNATAFGLERARKAGVDRVVVHERLKGADRRAWDTALADIVADSCADVVVLAGFLRILSSAFLDRFPAAVVNLHPARPGELAGLHAIERAYDEFTNGTRRASGVMVHLVPDEGVDSGPVLASVDVMIMADDTIQTFSERMHRAEHHLLVTTLRDFIHDFIHDRTNETGTKCSEGTRP